MLTTVSLRLTLLSCRSVGWRRIEREGGREGRERREGEKGGREGRERREGEKGEGGLCITYVLFSNLFVSPVYATSR